MNKVIMMGRPTGEPEIRYSQGANPMAIARFTLAVNRRYNREGEPTADFFNCTAFGSQAEFIEKYIRKGVKILVVGHIQNDNYTNKEGQKVYSVRVLIDEIEFAESKGASMQMQATGSQGSGRPSPTTASRDGFMTIPEGAEEELPFN